MEKALIKKHRVSGVSPTWKRRYWTINPCLLSLLQRDKVIKQESSVVHKGAVVGAADVSCGGIPHTCKFKDAEAAEMQAAIWCYKCIYWLYKHKISRTTTTYSHLFPFAESLRCCYIESLKVSHNAKYISPQIVG